MEKTLSSFNLLSHPKKLLVDHLAKVRENGHFLGCKLRLSDKLSKVLDLVLILHDLGKATSFFQEYMQATANYNEGNLSKKDYEFLKNRLGYRRNHARISAAWGLIIARNIFGPTAAEPLYVYIAILKHHGHLDDFENMLIPSKGQCPEHLKKELLAMSSRLDYLEFARILHKNNIQSTNFNHDHFALQLEDYFGLDHELYVIERQESLELDDFYNLSLIFSILLACDKGECIFDGLIYRRQAGKLPADLITHYKEKTFKKPDSPLNHRREQVYRSAETNLLRADIRKNRFFSINVPTGIGKTLTAVNAALRLLAREESLKKIIYCLPFTSVIDQNGKVIEEILRTTGQATHSENLVLFHHLSELEYRAKDDRGEIDNYQGEYLITAFESNINVTTFHQFLYGIFTHRNREIRKLSGFIGSIVILDEVQSIPHRYWPLVRRVLLDLAERLDMVFILVTATMPLIFDPDKDEIKELIPQKAEIFDHMNRICLDTSLLTQDLDLDQFAKLLAEDIRDHPHNSFLVILNTRRAATELYKECKPIYSSRLLFLSSDVTPHDRLARIDKIKKMDQPYIVISTQLVEAGVDIDCDRVYRDMAPLDAVFQSAGRCNRNHKQTTGTVFLISLIDLKGCRKQFAGYIYDSFNLSRTRQLLTKKTSFTEPEFFQLAGEYFRLTREKGNFDDGAFIQDQMTSLNYRTAFHYNEQNKRAFHLIDDRESISAYVMVTDEARDLYDKYRSLSEDHPTEGERRDPFKRKWEIKNHLKKMAPYMVSITVPVKDHSRPDNEPVFFQIITDDQHPYEGVASDYFYHPELGVQPRPNLTI